MVRPVLRLLDHTFEVQPALATPEGTRRPDYVLYKNAGFVAANKSKSLTDELLRGHAFALADGSRPPNDRVAV
jgi:predicted type IV restriction endonuclease